MLETKLQKTPLYSAHLEAGGKLVPFAGWELPVRYTELIEEHNAVRNDVGLFDVSHMGELLVSGKQATEYLQYLTCNDIKKLYPGKAQYNAFLNPKGGTIDDIIVYCFDANHYLICVNASNAEQDFNWCVENIEQFSVKVENSSSAFAQLALQGPKAFLLLDKIFAAHQGIITNLKTFHFAELDTEYGKVIIARTGYTGEDGVEIFCESEKADKLWYDLLKFGQEFSIKPCGLGARDSLRLEACYPLHGHELSPDRSALESGLGWIIKFDKGDFIGREVLLQEKELGLKQRLVGFIVQTAGLVREGTILFAEAEPASGQSPIGQVTSGTLTPTIKKSLGLAFIDNCFANLKQTIYAEVRGRRLPCEIVKTPFYKRSM